MSEQMPPKPTTLDELQSLTTDDFRAIDAYQYRGDTSPSKVIDDIIDLAADELEWGGRQDAGSLRDFWYNPVKPILEAALPEWGDGVGTSDWNRGLSKRLSKRLSKAVKDTDNDITYRSLNILDDSRDRRVATDSLENEKILFVEKSAAYRKLEPLANVYDLTLVEGSGWSATALIEDLSQKLNPETEYTFYVLGDYDPTGFGIVEDFVSRAQKLGIDVDDDRSRRIGVSPDQLPDETVQEQKFTVGGKGNDEWMAKYGIDGEYGLEIEAVGDSLGEKAEALRELVKDEIKAEIREDDRRVRDVENSASRVPDGAASKVVNRITNDLETALKEAARDVYADQDGVIEVDSRFGRAQVTVDNDAVLNGETGDLVPNAYPEGRLHSSAVSGRTPNPNGGRTAKSSLASTLEDRIESGDIDVVELLDL